MRLLILVVVFTLFTGWSLTVVESQGLFGFLTLSAREPWAAQMLIDLSISLFIAWSWLRVDAREKGIVAWPYIAATVGVGSIGVLAYLIHREFNARGTKRTVTA
jgi:hypothetical protein